MAAKNSGKTIFVKSPDESESLSHRFRDKYVVAFYTEIQDGKSCHLTQQIPWGGGGGGGGGGSKILSKLFYIATSEILKIFHFNRKNHGVLVSR